MPNFNLSAIVMVLGCCLVTFSIALHSLGLLVNKLVSVLDINRQSSFDLVFIFGTFGVLSIIIGANAFLGLPCIFSLSSLCFRASRLGRFQFFVIVLPARTLELRFASEEVQAVLTSLENTRGVTHTHLLDVAGVADS